MASTRGLKAVGLLHILLFLSVVNPVNSWGQAPDTLTLQQPENIIVVPQMAGNRQRFVNYIFWDEVPPVRGALIHQPDTLGWRGPNSPNPQDSLSVPSTAGAHTGTVDRTIKFSCKNNGRVGFTPNIKLQYEIVDDEQFENIIDIGQGYSPGEPIRLIFVNRQIQPQDTLELGIDLIFSEGLVDSNGAFLVGAEDFEGYHAWRAVESDGSDLTVLGEMSKQESFSGAPFDSLYYTEIIPALRETGKYNFPFPVPGLGSSIDLTDILPSGKLGPTQMAWFDLNAYNGFTYRYTVTTFDRGYTIRSRRQGLFKFNNCNVTKGVPYECPSYLVPVSNEVTAQNVMQNIYAVPNPYRSGSTQFSTPNYHNFPDNKMRFVNLPADCKLKIYTPAGDIVWWADNQSPSGNIEWDTTNASGAEVSSGVYIYRVEAANGDSMFGRIVIIR